MQARRLGIGVAVVALAAVITGGLIVHRDPTLTTPLGPAAGASGLSGEAAASSVAVDAVPIELRSPILPGGTLESTTPGMSYQVASSVSYAPPYAAVELGAIPYGSVNPALSALKASHGSAAAFRKEIADARAAVGQVFARALPATLFGQRVEGQVTQTVGLAGGVQTTRLHAEWVTEAGNRVWILRITADDLSDSARDQLVGQLPQVSVASPDVSKPTTVNANLPAGPPFRAADNSFSLDLPPWWGSKDCDGGRTSAHEVLATWNGLEACGPNVDLQSASFVGHPAWGWEYEWECVELSKRYLWQRYGVPDQPGDGFATVDAEARAAPMLVRYRPDGVHVPEAGDVVSFGTVSPGHTAVVMTSTVDASGNGTFTTINENVGRQAVITFDIRAWVPTTTHGGRGTGIPPVNDWLHDPANTPGVLGPGGLGKPGTGLATAPPAPVMSDTVQTPDHSIYRIAGMAPLRVFDCAALPGGCGSPQAIPNLNGLRPFPLDGTALVAGGTLYHVAGGAPLRVGACASGSACPTAIAVDPGAIARLDHLRAVPADGTFLRSGTSTWRIAGGAPLAIFDCSVIGGCGTPVTVTPSTLAGLDHLRATPDDGTLLRGRPSGALWLIRGGHRAATSPSQAVAQTAVVVTDAAVTTIPLATGSPSPSGSAAPTPSSSASTT